MKKILKGDNVIILNGNDAGKKGRVIKVLSDNKRVFVEGINVAKKHQKPTQDNPRGGIIEKENSICISNIMYVHKDKPTRIGFKVLDDGRKVRYAKKTGDLID